MESRDRRRLNIHEFDSADDSRNGTEVCREPFRERLAQSKVTIGRHRHVRHERYVLPQIASELTLVESVVHRRDSCSGLFIREQKYVPSRPDGVANCLHPHNPKGNGCQRRPNGRHVRQDGLQRCAARK